jgi:ABC-type transport system substrate-binding protein
MAMAPGAPAWEPVFVLEGYMADSPRNSGHVNDSKLTATVKEQRRTNDLEARKKVIFDIQRYVAEQQYRVLLTSGMITGSWQPYVKNYAPNQTFDYGSRAAALWLAR